MPKLEHSKVLRSGATVRHWNVETSHCSASVNQTDGTLEIRFDLASKGGGTTEVLLRIGENDFPAILQEIASKMPSSVGILSDCASIANKKNLELLTEARKVQGDEKARADSLIDDLEPVEEFVNEKWLAAPIGEDKEEERIKNLIQKAMSVLRDLQLRL